MAKSKVNKTKAKELTSPLQKSTISLETQILADDSFFAQRIELIPAEMYIHLDDEEREANSNWASRKFHKNVKMKAPKQNVKDATKKAAKRREKFENTNHESNADRIAKREAKENDDMTDSEDENPQNAAFSFQNKSEPAKSIEELRERLAKKLEAFKGGRNNEPKERPNRRAKAKPKKGGKPVKQQLQQESSEDTERKLREKVAATLTEPQYSFSVVDEAPAVKSYKDILKKGPGKRNILNVKKMLQKAEENVALLNELKNSGNPEDRQEYEEKVWDSLEKKAHGEKIANPKMLKKNIKRIESQKKKSAETWRARLETEKTTRDAALDKRDANIKAAADKKVARLLKRKGIAVEDTTQDGADSTTKRKRAGFEGRHSGFLNNGSKK